MATIITFPRTVLHHDKHRAQSLAARIVLMPVRIFWMLTVMVWPVLRWMVALDVTAQLFRMLMLFADRGIYVDWTFIAHFSGFTALLCFVKFYRS